MMVVGAASGLPDDPRAPGSGSPLVDMCTDLGSRKDYKPEMKRYGSDMEQPIRGLFARLWLLYHCSRAGVPDCPEQGQRSAIPYTNYPRISPGML
jgi:hypothetical protein